MRFGIVVNDKERQADRQKLAKALKPEDTMFPAFIGLDSSATMFSVWQVHEPKSCRQIGKTSKSHGIH